MVKVLSAVSAAAAVLLHGASAHMQVISPPPRSGVMGDQLLRPCGGGNEPTKNVTTFAASGDSEFELRPSHGTGNIIYSYFTDATVTNSSEAHKLDDIEVPEPGTYKTKLDFSKAGLKAGQDIVVQAIYNGTDDGKTEQYYVCFDIKLVDEAESSGDSESDDEESDNTGGSTAIATAACGIALAVLAAMV
ncbi:hypothetical protein GGF46_002425 [Coemansia sp. RSA 552]|nr:hypothetical protein GGF46_002425 [Coemansia sp. RSA 552]